MRCWMIRNPYKHHSWEDFIYRDSYSLYGIKGRYAQKQIASMKPGDKAVFYDRRDKVFAGIMEVVGDPYPDPTKPESGNFSVDFVPLSSLDPKLSYSEIGRSPAFQECLFFRQPRFSVCEVSEEQFRIISIKSRNCVRGD